MPKPLSEHEILLMLAALALFVGVARVFGEIAMRLRQPQVLGELLAGVVLGPSVLGLLDHGALAQVERGAHILEPLAWVGIILLLALTGMESDIASLRRSVGPASLTTIGGVIVPFVAAFALGEALPQSLIGANGSRLTFALFLALAMSISAVTVIAKVLADLGQTRRTAAKIILTGGVFDETLGWILLAFVTGIATSALRAGGAGHGEVGTGEIGLVVGKALGFLVLAALFGRRLVSTVIRVVRDRARIDEAPFTATVILALGFAAATQALGLYEILGAFVFGVIAGTVPRIDRETVERLRVVTRGFLVPLFFVFAGIKVDLTKLRHEEVLLIAAAFVAIAIAGKLVGCTAGGIVSGMRWREALLVGIGMSARGSMEIVLAVLGLNLGILSPTIFSVIVLLSIVTILVVPPALRVAFAATPPSSEERERIEREKQDESAYTPHLRRVLVPLFRDAPSDVGAELARALARSKAHAEEPLEIVVLQLNGDDPKGGQRRATAERLARTTESANVNAPRRIEFESHEHASGVASVIETAQRGYHLIIVGAAAPKRGRRLFTPEIDTVIREAPCDVLVVSSSVAFEVEHVKQIVVPFTGREPARASADLAIALASGIGARVKALSVVREPPIEGAAAIEQMERRRASFGTALAEARERAERVDVAFEGEVTTAVSPPRAILGALQARDVDLCILGVADQSRRGTPYFGDTADLLLRFAPVPVGLLVVRDRR